MSIDNQGGLRITVKRVNQPCEECGRSPALQYNLAGITGVLCRLCLQKEIDSVNQALQETNTQEVEAEIIQAKARIAFEADETNRLHVDENSIGPYIEP